MGVGEAWSSVYFGKSELMRFTDGMIEEKE